MKRENNRVAHVVDDDSHDRKSSSGSVFGSEPMSDVQYQLRVIKMNDLFPVEEHSDRYKTQTWTQLDNPLHFFELEMNRLPFLAESTVEFSLDRMRSYVKTMRKESFAKVIDELSVNYKETPYHLSNYSKWKKGEFAEKVVEFLCLFLLFYQLKSLPLEKLRQVNQAWQNKIASFPNVLNQYRNYVKNLNATKYSKEETTELRQNIACAVAAFYVQLHKHGSLHNVLQNRSNVMHNGASASSVAPHTPSSPSGQVKNEAQNSSNNATVGYVNNQNTVANQNNAAMSQTQHGNPAATQHVVLNQYIVNNHHVHYTQQQIHLHQQQLLLQLGANSTSDIPFLNEIMKCTTVLQLTEFEIMVMSKFKEYTDSLMQDYWKRLHSGNASAESSKLLFDGYARGSDQLQKSREAIRLRKIQLSQ